MESKCQNACACPFSKEDAQAVVEAAKASLSRTIKCEVAGVANSLDDIKERLCQARATPQQ